MDEGKDEVELVAHLNPDGTAGMVGSQYAGVPGSTGHVETTETWLGSMPIVTRRDLGDSGGGLGTL